MSNSDNYIIGICIATLGSFFSSLALLLQKNCDNETSVERQRHRHVQLAYVISCLCFLSGYVLDGFALKFVPVGIVGVLTTTQISWSAILAHCYRDEYVVPKSAFGVLFTSLGSVCLVLQMADHATDDFDRDRLTFWFVFVATVSIAGLALICTDGGRWRHRHATIAMMTCVLIAAISSTNTLILMNTIVMYSDDVAIVLLLTCVIIGEVAFQLKMINLSFRFKCTQIAFITSIFSGATVTLTAAASSVIYRSDASIDAVHVVVSSYGLLLVLFGLSLFD